MDEIYRNNIFIKKNVEDMLNEDKNIVDKINDYKTNLNRWENCFIKFKKKLFKCVGNID